MDGLSGGDRALLRRLRRLRHLEQQEAEEAHQGIQVAHGVLSGFFCGEPA